MHVNEVLPGRPRRPGAFRSAAAALVALGLLVACSSTPEPRGAAPLSAPATATAPAPGTPSAAPTPTEVEPSTSPFTGEPGGVGKPVMVVKIDNTRAAQPQRGLTSADLVYVEPVEGGLTRLAAVFSSTLPAVVGPVRSARIGDLTMLEPLGSAALVFSGAQTKLWPKLRSSDFVLFSEDLDSPGFYRDRTRYSPFNLMAHPAEMLASVDHVAVSHDIGLVFDPARPDGGQRARRVTCTWQGASVQFRWNAGSGAYDVWMNGRQARDVDAPGVQRASTVVIQYVAEVDSGYGDKFGGRTPLPITVGSGQGLVLRDGRSYPVHWDRGSSSEPTAYLGADGEPFAFDPGQVWIVLMNRDRPVTVG